ncbi:unnamed protein product [Urochloa humidicola]
MPLHLLSSPAAVAKLATGLRAAPLRRCYSFAPAPHHSDRVSLATSLSAAAAARSAGPAVAAAQTKLGVSGKKQVLISLSDKTDLAYLGNGLQGLG